MLDLFLKWESCYFLPEDGAEAEQCFLSLLRSPGETYISAYACNLAPLFAAIIAADASGVMIHMLLDHSQAVSEYERAPLQALVNALRYSDVTITTAGSGSSCPAGIWHAKTMVVLDPPREPSIWRGSVNFSKSGFQQGNTAEHFKSAPYARKAITQFQIHRAWALAQEPQYQLKKANA